MRRVTRLFKQVEAMPEPYSYSPNPVVVDAYSRTLSRLHWVMGAAVVGAVASVKLAQNTENKERKGTLMNAHKSLALVVLALLPLRLAARRLSRIPAPLPGPRLQQMAGNASHLALYGFVTALPLSGVAMGYFSGFGVPFFFIPKAIKGSETPDKPLANAAYKAHSVIGQVFVFFLPIHVGGALFHYFKGQKIFQRINPF